ncbi:hypothetical protein DM806_09740 [Sphingobium lactosutens]|uniref:DUF1330 domain-containing protein n=1 Tax=Sphingobium lactosutens TaxID=522773 RepID=UPI0015C09A91|nr:DUF1330 domain-containing protein [Sphingobium lactosutens]NWK95951.1 hypothetical protein [Sphingobium lactosutens]
MAAYVIFCISNVHDEESLAEYRRQVVPLIEATPGVKFFAGPVPFVVEEGLPITYGVVIECADLEAAKSWYYSEDYQRVAAFRHKASDGFAFILESWTGPVH